MPPVPRGMGMQIGQQLAQAALTTEIIYSFVLIAISLIIYFSTKEFYDLTKYKGIKYFRFSFLFFAVSFFFRSFIKIIIFFWDIPQELSSIVVFFLQYGTYFLFMYFSALAVFYLVYSIKYKKWGRENESAIFFNIISAVIALIVVITNSIWVILAINLIFLISILSVILTSKGKNKLHIIYVLLFLFWIFNIIDIFIPSVLQFYQLIFYIASISVFLAILYKVLVNLGGK